MIKKVSLSLMIFSISLSLWAAQDGIVTTDKAVVYADELMTSPIGFVAKGKRVRVGDIARNKGQVYPIIVSGKMAFIRVFDISTEKESLDSDRLVLERFQKKAASQNKTQYSFGYFVFNSQVKNEKSNGLADNDALNWGGLYIRGNLLVKKYWDLQVISNLLTAKEDKEEFRVLEVGMGTAYRLIDKKKFIIRAEAHILAIPFASYEVEDAFRNNGYGITLGGGLNFNYRFTERWGAMAMAGIYYTKMSGFEAPEDFEEIAPSFTGNRIGLGVTYQF